MEKDIIISRLYTLRAGLSVISQEKRNIDRRLAENEKNRAAQTKNLQDSQSGEEARVNRAIANAKKDHSEKKKKYDECRVKYEETRDIAECSLSRARISDFFGRIRKGTGTLLKILPIIIALAAIAYSGMVFYWVISGSYKNGNDNLFLTAILGWFTENSIGYLFLFIFLVIPASIGLVLLIYFWWDPPQFLNLFKCRTDHAQEIRAARKRLDGERQAMNTAKQTMDKAQAYVTKLENELREVQGKGKKQAAALNLSLTAGKAALIEYLKPIGMACIALFDGLQAAFGRLVDVRDWGNLDYLIYSMETGRADSVKEALQLADREEQTNRILEAVAMASAAICRSITAGLARLQNDMRVCFATLTNEMTRQNAIIMEGVAGVSQQVANVSQNVTGLAGAIAELSSETRLSNALLEESNQTSSKLADDVHQLRYYADYAAIRSA